MRWTRAPQRFTARDNLPFTNWIGKEGQQRPKTKRAFVPSPGLLREAQMESVAALLDGACRKGPIGFTPLAKGSQMIHKRVGAMAMRGGWPNTHLRLFSK